MNEIHEEIKGIVNEKYKETKTDIDNARNECEANSVIHASSNDKASLNQKIQQIET